tara:strand:+ start:131 stop:316 length:186 start_codon:yes stop_codon:yes gene_type:complete
MFKRIIYDDWASIIPIISFCLTFGVFLVIVARALLLRKSTVHHMENLPLDDGDNSNTQVSN